MTTKSVSRLPRLDLDLRFVSMGSTSTGWEAPRRQGRLALSPLESGMRSNRPPRVSRIAT